MNHRIKQIILTSLFVTTLEALGATAQPLAQLSNSKTSPNTIPMFQQQQNAVNPFSNRALPQIGNKPMATTPGRGQAAVPTIMNNQRGPVVVFPNRQINPRVPGPHVPNPKLPNNPPQTTTGLIKLNVSAPLTSGLFNLTFTNAKTGKTLEKNVRANSSFELPPASYNVSAKIIQYNGKNYYAQSIVPAIVNIVRNQTTALTVNYALQPEIVAIYAPYLDVKKVADPFAVVKEAGLHAVTLGFITPDANCHPVLSNPKVTKEVIQDFKRQHNGNRVILSTGEPPLHPIIGRSCKPGAGGVEDIVAAYNQIISEYGITDLDFYFPAFSQYDSTFLSALAALEKQHPSLKISFTISFYTLGLSAIDRMHLQNAIDAGVVIHRINLYPAGPGPDPNYNDGPSAIKDGVNNAIAQLQQQIYKDKTEKAIGAMLGLTPYIGTTHQGLVALAPNDVPAIIQFAREKGIMFLSSIALNRDYPCANPDDIYNNTCSGFIQNKPIQEKPFVFANAFNQFNQEGTAMIRAADSYTANVDTRTENNHADEYYEVNGGTVTEKNYHIEGSYRTRTDAKMAEDNRIIANQ